MTQTHPLTPPEEPVAPTVIGPEWQPCVKLPITVHVREQRPGETHSSTREGITPLRPDDLIMRGVRGEEYPIGRELFNQTYRMGAALAQPEPVAPSERLPGPEDCDAEGRCWWWHPDHKEDDFDDGWILLNPKWAGGRRDSDDSLIYTHWLPANALPNPEALDD